MRPAVKIFEDFLEASLKRGYGKIKATPPLRGRSLLTGCERFANQRAAKQFALPLASRFALRDLSLPRWMVRQGRKTPPI